MLAHNATVLEVPFELGRLIDEPFSSPYLEALGLIADEVHKTRQRHQAEVENRAQGAG